MSPHISDGKRSCIIAAALIGFAAIVLLAFHPGGFETQGAWLLVLLPGTLPAYFISDFVDKVAPRAEPVVFWTSVVTLNFFGIG